MVPSPARWAAEGASLVRQELVYDYSFQCFQRLSCQGVSTASAQGGLKDKRTGLVKHIFRVFDTLPQKQQPRTQGSGFCRVCGFAVYSQWCSLTVVFGIFLAPFLMRRFLYFENVKALLGKKQSMRNLFHYVAQDFCVLYNFQ